MNINIPTDENKYFHQIIEILQVFAPFNNLRKRQREVFAEILYHNHLLRDEKEDLRNRLLFDSETRKEISRKLGISKANLYNIYKELRQKNLLTKNGINTKFRYGFLQYPEITFTFKSKDNKKQDISGEQG